ncbi:hypothetical protein Ahy_B01g052374 [Arachis hypogaea]|uniref:Uncharacterized protein n=1 Tax=Arachis hypogaea TaxID=3818 RepID=A0A445APA1_ARAHY|nr:hypothetical protein Ahy_B01g052374 [Arachis hypogaea]
MEGIVNLRVYYNGEIIPNTHEGVTFVCECPFFFVILCTTSFVELQNGLCENIQSHISKRVSNILYRNHVQVFGGLIQFQIMSITDDACMQQMFYIYQQTRFHVLTIELYVEFEHHTWLDAIGKDVNVDELGDIDWGEDNNDSKEEFETNYKVDDENDDEDDVGNSEVQNEADALVNQHPFGVPSFMRTLDLAIMHALEFPEYANMGEGNIAAEDGEFSVGMEFGSRESVISAIKSYTIPRGVDYTMYDSEPQTFYAKYKGYGAGCVWLIRASLIRKKGCWKIRRYNGKHTCTTEMISQDHSKVGHRHDADAIRTEQEYNKNYQGLKERGEAYTQWCDDIRVERWLLAFDGSHRWGMTTNLVECRNFVLKGTHNLPVTAIVRSTFYQLNKLFTRKSVETHECVCNRFTYSEFATKRVEENF